MFPHDFLVDLLKNNPEKAIPILYDKYSSSLYGVVLRIVKVEEDAQDLLQEIFVKIWKKRDLFDHEKGRLFTWMMQIARNTSINFIQSKSQKIKEKIHPIDAGVYHINSKNKINVETLDMVYLLDKLEEKYREVIELAYFQGYTQKEISDRLEIPLGTVKSCVRIGIRKLRNIYDGNTKTGFLIYIILFQFMTGI